MADDTTIRLIKDLSKKFDSRFDKIDSKLKSVDSRFDKMDSKFDKMDSRFDKMEVSLDFVKMDVKRIEKQAEEIDRRNEKRYNKVMNHIDGLAKGFKKFDEEQTILSAHSKNHTDRIEKLEEKAFGVNQI